MLQWLNAIQVVSTHSIEQLPPLVDSSSATFSSLISTTHNLLNIGCDNLVNFLFLDLVFPELVTMWLNSVLVIIKKLLLTFPGLGYFFYILHKLCSLIRYPLCKLSLPLCIRVCVFILTLFMDSWIPSYDYVSRFTEVKFTFVQSIWWYYR